MARGKRALEHDAGEAGRAGEGDVGLAVSEAMGQIDNDPVEGLALGLVDGNTPGEHEGQLGVGAGDLGRDLS